MQEINFTSLTNCQQQRKVLHYGTLFQVKDCSHAPLCTYVPLQCLSANHMLTVCGLFSQKVSVINPLHRSHTYHTYAAREGAICCPPD